MCYHQHMVSFYVFSGTGNTEKAARFLSSHIEGSVIYPIKRLSPVPMPKEGETCVLCYPVHAFNAPYPVERFVSSLPSVHADIWIMKTSGEGLRLNSASSSKLVRLLRRKGYRVMGEFWYLMPYNIMVRHSDAMAARMERKAAELAVRDAERIKSREQLPLDFPLYASIASFLLQIEGVAAPYIGRFFRTADNCTLCGRCVSGCPESNISIEDGHIVFGKNCSLCMSCAFSCPSDAVRIALLDSWRVNGSYDTSVCEAENDEIAFCRRSYIRYFES